MSLNDSDDRLRRISKSKKAELKGFKAGVHLERASGRTIDDLHQQACADRLRLAEGFLAAGHRLMRARPPMRRIAVGRYYYAMYHAIRAVVYLRTQGDDHEQHSNLPQWIPNDFPNYQYWQNELKDARLRRNEADYDPYPTKERDFLSVAKNLQVQAAGLVSAARAYLRSKGCAHL